MCAPHARAAAAAAHLNHPPTRVHLKRSRLYALPLRRAKWDRRARSAGVELETAAHANGAGARPHVWAATCVGAAATVLVVAAAAAAAAAVAAAAAAVAARRAVHRLTCTMCRARQRRWRSARRGRRAATRRVLWHPSCCLSGLRRTHAALTASSKMSTLLIRYEGSDHGSDTLRLYSRVFLRGACLGGWAEPRRSPPARQAPRSYPRGPGSRAARALLH